MACGILQSASKLASISQPAGVWNLPSSKPGPVWIPAVWFQDGNQPASFPRRRLRQRLTCTFRLCCEGIYGALQSLREGQLVSVRQTDQKLAMAKLDLGRQRLCPVLAQTSTAVEARFSRRRLKRRRQRGRCLRLLCYRRSGSCFRRFEVVRSVRRRVRSLDRLLFSLSKLSLTSAYLQETIMIMSCIRLDASLFKAGYLVSVIARPPFRACR